MVPLPQANSASAIAGVFWEHLHSDIRQAKSLNSFWQRKIVCDRKHVRGRKPRKKKWQRLQMQGMGGGRFCLCLPLPHSNPRTTSCQHFLQAFKESWNDCLPINQSADFPHNVTTIKFSKLQGTNNVCYDSMEKTTFYFVKTNYDMDRHRKGVG